MFLFRVDTGSRTEEVTASRFEVTDGVLVFYWEGMVMLAIPKGNWQRAWLIGPADNDSNLKIKKL